MTLTCGLLEALCVDAISLDIRKNIFQRVGGQILDHEVVGSPSLEIRRARLDQVLRNLIWSAWLCSGAGDTQTSLLASSAWCLGAPVIRGRAMLTQAVTRTSSIPLPSPALEAGEILNATAIQVAAFIYLRDCWFSANAAHEIIVITLFGGNEDLNSSTWTFQNLQRSSSSSHTHTKKNPS